MNKELAEVIKLYATEDHSAVARYLLEKSKDNVNAMLLDLLTMYFNDRNSSTLREYMLVTLSGFTPNEAKLGYNGYRQKTIAGRVVRENCEAKPRNINTNSTRKTPSKLDGGGGFNDYSFARLEKHKRDNALVVVGGFIDGKLIYIFRFPFNSPSLVERLHGQLLKKYPDGRDVGSDWLRSASFRLDDYKDAKNLEVEVFVDKTQLAEFKPHIRGKLYRFLTEHAR